jgi:CRISPR-associated RAMP protein (TIGR02581 family)
VGSPVDLSVLRIPYEGKHLPYIPGSSLKGVFRSFASLLAKKKGLRKACSGVSEDVCKPDEKGGAESFYNNACLICKIFGSPGYRSLASFGDAYPIDDEGRFYPYKTGVRRGIRIGRRTGAVSGSSMYDVEYVEPGAKFRFSIRCKNLPNYALGLLSKVLLLMQEGEAKLGGFKTRGFGGVSIDTNELEFRTEPVKHGRMEALDEKDMEFLLHAETENGYFEASNDAAWELIKKLAEIWEHAKL